MGSTRVGFWIGYPDGTLVTQLGFIHNGGHNRFCIDSAIVVVGSHNRVLVVCASSKQNPSICR
jgi:hypothetical protein